MTTSTTIADPAPIRESWKIWNSLVRNGGLDAVYYDNEFLNGNSSFNGLSQYLGFKIDKNNIVERLKKNNVSSEKFLGAFFRVLQPYAQMMNDLCVFFSNYKVKETNESLKIVFDYSKVCDQLDFNLENFKTTLTTYTKIKKKVTYYHLDNVWSLHYIFRDQELSVNRDDIIDQKAAAWLKAYEHNRHIKPDLVVPPTGYESLDFQLKRVIDLWADYVNTCRTYSEDISEFRIKVLQDYSKPIADGSDQDEIMAGIDLNLNWSIENLGAEIDRWSATMIELLFGNVKAILNMTAKDRDEQASRLEASLSSYFDGLSRSEAEIEDIIAELTDLFNLPIWKKRYELYSTWVLSALDQVFAGYDREVHYENGVLKLSFAAKHLMTIQSTIGPFELWAENRTLAINPTGHGRKRGIQPDYTIYQPTVGNPNDCIACIEVKQYRKANVGNFRNAINDYANGLPNAHIFLVNYGPRPASLILAHPSRSNYYGDIKPASSGLTTFSTALLAVLPPAKPLTNEEILKITLTDLSIDTLFVDVSGSMSIYMIREYIRACLGNLVRHKKVKNLVALDDQNVFLWDKPDQNSVADLLLSHFYSGGDFDINRVGVEGNNLIVTDYAGADNVWESIFRPILILIKNQNAELWTFSEQEGIYLKIADEPLETSYDYQEKGFVGWLFNTVKTS